MPRGFLVKRSQHLTAFSYRERRGSDDEKGSDSGSELDGAFSNTCYGSPDSGFSVSPVPVSRPPCKERAWERDNAHTITNSWTTSVVASALPLALTSACSASATRLSSLSPLSSSSLASPAVRSAPCTPNKVPTTASTTTSAAPAALAEQAESQKKTGSSDPVNQPSPLTFTAFDTLSLGAVTKAQPPGRASPAGSGSGSGTPVLPLSPAPSSPGNRKRSGSRTDEKSLAPSQPGKAKAPSPKKLRAARRINFDVDTTSPVSGTIIKELSDCEDEQGRVTVYGDIEPSFNVVEITPEARAELDKIDNKLGDYVCQLCKELYEDAFQLAQHRCSRIVHVEYRCPECEKVFNCPANLASHRRWHKPRPAAGSQTSVKSSSSSAASHRSLLPAPAHRHRAGAGPPGLGQSLLSTGLVPTATTDPEKLLLTRLVNGKQALAAKEEARAADDLGGERSAEEAPFSCETCGKKFRRQAYLRKHAQSHGAKGGVAGRPRPFPLAGKVMLNDNDRLKHELEHKKQLANSNILNNNNNNNNNSATVLPTSATTVVRVSPPAIAAAPDSNTLASLDTNTLNNNNNNNNHNDNNNTSRAGPRPKGTILATPTLSPRDLNPQPLGSANPVALLSARDSVCSVCGATCPSKAALEKHVRSHAQETFPCKYCDSTFYSSPGLTRHINKCHPTENRQVILLQLPVTRTC